MTMMTSAVAIDVANSRFFIENTIESAPKGLMIREFIRNAIEAMVNPDDIIRLIRFFADSEGRLAIINNGQGMDATELRNATELASSGANKIQGINGRNNRGEGAKISALRFNSLGMRYRSRKDGVISEVLLFNDNGPNGVGWAREQIEIDGSYYEVWEIDADSLSEEEAERYSGFPADFTEVMLFGNEEHQKTAFNPYGDAAEKAAKLAIAHELFGRFYRFPNIGVPIRVQFNEAFRGGMAFRDFIPVEQIVESHPESFKHVDERFVTLDDGVKIEYLMYTTDDKHRSPFTQYSQGTNSGLGGVVWQDEIYASLLDPMWGYEASNYGLVGLGKMVSVFVHLPDDYGVRDDRFRENLQRANGEKITLRDFQSLIISNRPQWLLDIIDSQHNKSSSSKAVNDKLKAHAAMLKRPVSTNANGTPSAPGLTVLTGGAVPSGSSNINSTSKSGSSEPGHGSGSGHGTGGAGQGNRSVSASSSRKAPTMTVMADSKGIPDCVWTDDMQAYPMLINRGAHYVETQGLYILNQTYPAFKKIVSEVIHQFILPKRPYLIRDADMERMVEGKVKDHVATLVGMAILNAENKRNTPAWNDVAIQSLLSIEALTSVYDVCLSDACYISPAVTNLPEFRNKDSLAKQAAA